MDIDLVSQPTRKQRVIKIFSGLRAARRLSLAEILALINLALVAPASISYLMNTDQREKERQYQAWQVLALGTGRQESGGRIHALQDLASSGVRLQKINLSGAYLRELRIPGADLKGALGDHADFSGGYLRGTILARAVINSVGFYRTDLNRADLSFAAAEKATFVEAAACDALFIGAILRDADFSSAQLAGARFDGADLRGAQFVSSSLPAAAHFRHANIADLKAPSSFIEAARLQGAVAIRDNAQWSRYTTQINDYLRAEWNQADALRLTARGSSPACKTQPLAY